MQSKRGSVIIPLMVAIMVVMGLSYHALQQINLVRNAIDTYGKAQQHYYATEALAYYGIASSLHQPELDQQLVIQDTLLPGYHGTITVVKNIENKDYTSALTAELSDATQEIGIITCQIIIHSSNTDAKKQSFTIDRWRYNNCNT